jgi:hypothetical protein
MRVCHCTVFGPLLTGIASDGSWFLATARLVPVVIFGLQCPRRSPLLSFKSVSLNSYFCTVCLCLKVLRRQSNGAIRIG